MLTIISLLFMLHRPHLTTTVQTSAARKPLIIRGAIPYWDQPAAVKSFTDNISAINQVALFWYYIDIDGKVTKYEYANADPAILKLAREHKVKTLFTLTNLGEKSGDNWDSKRVEKVISSDTSRKKHIADIMSTFNKLPFDGVNIDYESVAPSQRQNFSTFIKQLALVLHNHGKILSISLHPIDDSDNAKRYFFQDQRTLLKSVDFASVMAYDQHENSSGPGSIASYQWVKRIVNRLKAANLPLNKVLLGVPLYGYDWKLGSDQQAADVTYPGARDLIAKYNAKVVWDSTSRTPHFSYKQNDYTHQVWYENAASEKQKIILARDSGLGGISFWRLGEEDPGTWLVVKNQR